MIHTAILTLVLDLEGCRSLKEKRGLIKPLIERTQRQFNVSVAEADRQDVHDQAVISIGAINTNPAFLQQYLAGVQAWIEQYFPDLTIADQTVEML
jgi:uncharacterized protein